jgi:hypothetical protein
MPKQVSKFPIEVGEVNRAKLNAIIAYMQQLRLPYGEDELYTHRTFNVGQEKSPGFEVNLSSVVDGCLRKLMYDIDQGVVNVERLRELSVAYHEQARSEYATITLSKPAQAELLRLFEWFLAHEIMIKPISRRNQPNRKSPLHVAIWYCYEYVVGKE